jgi:hypothetical protein
LPLKPITDILGCNPKKEQESKENEDEKDYLPTDIDKTDMDVKFSETPVWAQYLTVYVSPVSH